jgi:hypothetical protein
MKLLFLEQKKTASGIEAVYIFDMNTITLFYL